MTQLARLEVSGRWSRPPIDDRGPMGWTWRQVLCVEEGAPTALAPVPDVLVERLGRRKVHLSIKAVSYDEAVARSTAALDVRFGNTVELDTMTSLGAHSEKAFWPEVARPLLSAQRRRADLRANRDLSWLRPM